ncbi:MAG TPA: hypothetical protein ENN61_05840 [Bacteroidaceae bacterium]|nr:hypothetical protein [Bacteroidaceae bacterium]
MPNQLAANICQFRSGGLAVINKNFTELGKLAFFQIFIITHYLAFGKKMNRAFSVQNRKTQQVGTVRQHET